MIIDSPEAMLAAGQDMAKRLMPGDIVTLSGGLGAGKTLFCKGVLLGLGFDGEVPSPTFTIMNHYAPPECAMPVVHADLYRLNDAEELDELGLADGADEGIVLVEWPEQASGAFAAARYRIEITRLDETRRELTIEENG